MLSSIREPKRKQNILASQLVTIHVQQPSTTIIQRQEVASDHLAQRPSKPWFRETSKSEREMPRPHLPFAAPTTVAVVRTLRDVQHSAAATGAIIRGSSWMQMQWHGRFSTIPMHACMASEASGPLADRRVQSNKTIQPCVAHACIVLLVLARDCDRYDGWCMPSCVQSVRAALLTCHVFLT